jgi:hypothetical protein
VQELNIHPFVVNTLRARSKSMCDNTKLTSDECKQAVGDKSAADVCREIEKKSKGILTTAMDDIAEYGGNVVNAVAGLFGAHAQSTAKLRNQVTLNLDTKTLTKQVAKCKTVAGQSASNTIIGGVHPECWAMLKEANLPIMCSGNSPVLKEWM